jgi:hypothetical protein
VISTDFQSDVALISEARDSCGSLQSTPGGIVSVTPKLEELVRIAATQFRTLNRTKSLSAADKKQLQMFFLSRMIGPRVRDVLRDHTNGRTNALLSSTNGHRSGQLPGTESSFCG